MAGSPQRSAARSRREYRLERASLRALGRYAPHTADRQTGFGDHWEARRLSCATLCGSLAPLLLPYEGMKEICEDIKSHVPEVVTEWEWRVREQPWYSLPAEHRIDNLPEVIARLVEASLCNPADEAAHRQEVRVAAEHGANRREQGIPEHMILIEYHLLRQALWHYILRTFGGSDRTHTAIMRIDTAITLATNASMWGYHRAEIEALGKWEEGVEQITASSPFLRQYPSR